MLNDEGQKVTGQSAMEVFAKLFQQALAARGNWEEDKKEEALEAPHNQNSEGRHWKLKHITEVLRKLKNKKSPGIDELYPEYFKNGGEKMDIWVLYTFY